MKKFKTLLLALIVVVLVTGCGSAIKNKDKKVEIYKPTGQTLQNNILCKPTKKDLIELYNKYDKQLKVSMKKLPECKNFKINSNKTRSLWEFIFVKPLAYLILKLGYAIKNFGLSVMIVGILIRIILLPFSKKSQLQSQNLQKATPEIQRLEIKYKDKTDSASMMAKSQETMMIYKKYGVNPMSGCLLAFIQLPLFFGFLQAINRVPAIFEGKFLGLSLGMTPSTGISKGNYFYIILIVLVLLTTYYSFKKTLNQTATAQQGQSKSMLIIMLVMIFVASFSLPTAIALYWIVTNAFIVVQNYLIDLSIKNDEKKGNKKENKSTKKVSIKEKVEKRRGN
ncbi:MAG: YidC/Oxa1 family membrane protein insertase [Bacilli bacterium]|nr:YidC/Oxa1 family membrane protein insertase [Bacilli bacterium]